MKKKKYARPPTSLGLPWWLSGKEFACQCRRWGFNPWVRKIPWRRKWQPTPVFLPGKFHGWSSLASYSPWCHKRVRHDLATDISATYFLCVILQRMIPLNFWFEIFGVRSAFRMITWGSLDGEELTLLLESRLLNCSSQMGLEFSTSKS